MRGTGRDDPLFSTPYSRRAENERGKTPKRQRTRTAADISSGHPCIRRRLKSVTAVRSRVIRSRLEGPLPTRTYYLLIESDEGEAAAWGTRADDGE